jgi:hypothetical protein
MVKVFIQEKVGSKLTWAIRKVISVGAIRNQGHNYTLAVNSITAFNSGNGLRTELVTVWLRLDPYIIMVGSFLK